MDALTNTILSASRNCLMQHYLKAVCMLQKERTSTPLRMGSVFHWGKELQGLGDPDHIEHALNCYHGCPEWADPSEWAVERETVRVLLKGHEWRYQEDTLETLATEQTFEMPMTNPRTGRASRTFCIRGKIDKIVRLPDGRVAIREYKTAGCDVGPDSDYWLFLQHDWQVSIYVLAARFLGFDAVGALYDVARKPTTRPNLIPQLDSDGIKIVLDADGNRVMKKDGTPRQTGDAEKGWVLQSRTETAEEYGARVLEDIYARPDFYFQRKEVPRTEDTLIACQQDISDWAQFLLPVMKSGNWPRHTGKMTCDRCDYKSLCLSTVGVPATPDSPPPAGFVRSETASPELEEN
jgi:hypothetical protein